MLNIRITIDFCRSGMLKEPVLFHDRPRLAVSMSEMGSVDEKNGA